MADKESKSAVLPKLHNKSSAQNKPFHTSKFRLTHRSRSQQTLTLPALRISRRRPNHFECHRPAESPEPSKQKFAITPNRTITWHLNKCLSSSESACTPASCFSSEDTVPYEPAATKRTGGHNGLHKGAMRNSNFPRQAVRLRTFVFKPVQHSKPLLNNRF